MKLISMTDFVLEQRKLLNKYINHDKGILFERCASYANFLKQPLELWMFVPYDENGNILDIPNHLNYDLDYIKKYKKEKERCLFDDFEVSENTDGEKVVLGDYTCLKISDLENGCVEDLTKYVHIKLTPTAQKQIGCAP